MFTVLKLERGYDRKGGLLCKPQGKCKISSLEYDLEDLFRMQNDLNISIVRLDPPQLLSEIVTVFAIHYLLQMLILMKLIKHLALFDIMALLFPTPRF